MAEFLGMTESPEAGSARRESAGPAGLRPAGAEVAGAEELAGLLAGIQRLVRRRLRHGLTGPPLRGAEVELLRTVAAEPGIGVSAAARSLHLAGNSVSTLVNRLVAADLLIRTPDPADRRAARLEITEAAARRLAEWERRRRELFAVLLAELSQEEQAVLAAAVPALRHLADNLRDLDALGRFDLGRVDKEAERG